MFKRGFNFPNVLALILGLIVAIYLAEANRNTAPDVISAADSAQPGE
jgi:hypothetical protein